MRIRDNMILWLAVYAILIVLFSNAFQGYLYSIYFVSLLFPVIVATAYVFNYYLVPKYLIVGKYGKFTLYFLYTLIVSLHLEMVIIFLTFIYLANYEIIQMDPVIRNVWVLTITLYAIVFVQGFILLFKKFQESKRSIEALTDTHRKNQRSHLIVRSERQNKRILFGDILYIESFADYVKIHLESKKTIITKQKISKIASELPDIFVRIHRSFIINKKHLSSSNADHLVIGEEKLSIGRTYKNQVKGSLH